MTSGQIIVAAIAVVAAGCAMASAQQIEPDVTKWIEYKVNYGEGTVWLRVPPNHRYKDRSTKLSRPFKSREPYRNQIFTAQYDYGWRRWNDIAQFEVTFTIIRLLRPLPSDVPLTDFRSELTKAIERADGQPSVAKDWSTEQTAVVSPLRWMRSFDSSNAFAETFATLCSPSFALVVTPRYWGTDLASVTDWKEQRRSLMQPLMAAIRCQ